MVFKKILIDTNICIDAIENSKPFSTAAVQILEASEKGDIAGYVSAHSFDTLFYILIQTTKREHVYKAIEALRRTIHVAPVNQTVIDKALQDKWSDFEDAIHYHAALEAGCDAIVTRNQKDFTNSNLSVLSPEEFLNQLT